MGSRKEVGVKAAATTANVTCNLTLPFLLQNINKENTRPAEKMEVAVAVMILMLKIANRSFRMRSAIE